LHQRLEHLLPGGEAEPEERGLRVGEDREQRQRHLHRGDGRDGRGFPGGRSCATSLHGGSLPFWSQQPPSLPDGGRSRRSSLSWSVQQVPGHPPAGPDGNLWFTESVGNKIARVTLHLSCPAMPKAGCRMAAASVLLLTNN